MTSLPTGGTLKKSGSDLIVNDTFTQADVNSGLITYVAPTSGSSDSFGFSVTDGQSTPLSGTFAITLTGVTQVYINELYLNPQGSDAPNESSNSEGRPVPQSAAERTWSVSKETLPPRAMCKTSSTCQG